ncbi:hypothetical protein MED193_10258, partial [Roseobacter sp. MED193]
SAASAALQFYMVRSAAIAEPADLTKPNRDTS